MPGKYRSSTPSSPLQLTQAAGGSWAMQSNPSQDGTIQFGTMGTPSRFVDTTTALGLDQWNFVSGKTGGGLRTVATFGNRGGSFGDDVRIVFGPAGGAYPASGNPGSAIDAVFVSPSVYQFRFKPGSASAVPTEVLRLDGTTLVTSMLGGCVRPMIAAAKTANYTVLLSDYSMKADTTGGAFAITLPDAALCAGQEFEIKRINASANLLTIKSTAGTLDGAVAGTGFTLATQYQSRTLRSDGTNWHIVSAYL